MQFAIVPDERRGVVAEHPLVVAATLSSGFAVVAVPATAVSVARIAVAVTVAIARAQAAARRQLVPHPGLGEVGLFRLVAIV